LSAKRLNVLLCGSTAQRQQAMFNDKRPMINDKIKSAGRTAPQGFRLCPGCNMVALSWLRKQGA